MMLHFAFYMYCYASARVKFDRPTYSSCRMKEQLWIYTFDLTIPY